MNGKYSTLIQTQEKKINTAMLTKPFLAKCGDRSSMPKSHPSSGSPEEWLSDEMLAPHNLSGITFDFFVNWSATPNSITPVIWLKRILLPEFSYQQVLENLENILISGQIKQI